MGRVKSLALLRAVVMRVAYMSEFVGDPSGNQVASELSPEVTSRSTVYRYLVWGYKQGLLDYDHEAGVYFWRCTPRGQKFLERWNVLLRQTLQGGDDHIWGEAGLPANE